jgi:hypothetical protein
MRGHIWVKGQVEEDLALGGAFIDNMAGDLFR